MRYFFLIVFVWLCLFNKSQTQQALIPLPNKCVEQKGEFKLSASTKVYFIDQTLSKDFESFNAYLNRDFGFKLQRTKKANEENTIHLSSELKVGAKHEAYELKISKERIDLNGDSTGVFYGFQTLIQLIGTQKSKTLQLPCLAIEDGPRFAWRGMHLDVCRHFFDVSFVKRYIDFLAMYKLNTFHWHLTEDQGWRIEIKKYPLLTKVGAFRKGSMIGAYAEAKVDTLTYGGFYSQEEIKEVVKYAQEKHITIVPEIEMPGHSQAAISAYPWLSCNGQNPGVAKDWGVFEDVFCAKDSTIQFLKDVLDEVISLFPGKYIHIGGDECPKTRWKQCLNCQAIIKKENLKDEQELQSYFIKKVEAYLNSKSKQIIGWDEILEGGLAPNAAVMSWRGEEGGMAAAKSKHKAVMSPGSHCYFDHYQASPSDEPIAIGGFTPLEKVYAYEPIPKELNKEESTYILGAQANVWTEYILNEKQVEYMTMPRMAALSEVLWTMPENKNETNFLVRLQKHFLLLDQMHVNYAKALYQISYKIRNDIKPKQLFLELIANPYLGEIHYTLDGADPSLHSTKYTAPLELNSNTIIKCALFQSNQQMGKVLTKQFEINKATNKKIEFKTAPSKYYNKGGSFILVNSETAKLPRVNDQWLAWSGDDIDLTIDLENLQEINKVEIGFLKEAHNWIYLPKEVQVFLSEDGKDFTEVQKINNQSLIEERFAVFNFKSTKAKFVRVLAKNKGKINSGMPGAGQDAWLFCDEVKIN